MYSNIVRSDEYKNCLLEFIKQTYNIEAAGFTPARRGFYGETWRLIAVDTSYFLKLDYSPHQSVYENSFPVIEHLCNHGIDYISRIVKAADGRLSTRFDGAVLGVFDWIDGENVENDATKIPEYQMLAKIYAVPSVGVNIPREDFLGKSADRFFIYWKAAGDRQLLLLLEKNRAKLEHRAKRLKYYSGMCRGDAAGFYITHGDDADFYITHGDAGGNLVVSGDKYYIVDWDEPILAPPERDAWVMCSRGWARDAFHEAMRQNGISHTLRPERLAYYCYHYFFFYLISFLDAYKPTETVQAIEEYIDGWIEDSINYADNCFQ